MFSTSRSYRNSFSSVISRCQGTRVLFLSQQYNEQLDWERLTVLECLMILNRFNDYINFLLPLVMKDLFPRWRKLSWNNDGTLLAFAYRYTCTLLYIGLTCFGAYIHGSLQQVLSLFKELPSQLLTTVLLSFSVVLVKLQFLIFQEQDCVA